MLGYFKSDMLKAGGFPVSVPCRAIAKTVHSVQTVGLASTNLIAPLQGVVHQMIVKHHKANLESWGHEDLAIAEVLKNSGLKCIRRNTPQLIHIYHPREGWNRGYKKKIGVKSSNL